MSRKIPTMFRILLKPAATLLLGMVLGFVIRDVYWQAPTAEAQLRESPPRSAFPSGGVQSAFELRKVGATLQRIEQSVKRIEQAVQQQSKSK